MFWTGGMVIVLSCGGIIVLFYVVRYRTSYFKLPSPFFVSEKIERAYKRRMRPYDSTTTIETTLILSKYDVFKGSAVLRSEGGRGAFSS